MTLYCLIPPSCTPPRSIWWTLSWAESCSRLAAAYQMEFLSLFYGCGCCLERAELAPRQPLSHGAHCQGWSWWWARGPGSCSLVSVCGVPSCPQALLSSEITRSRPTSWTLSTCHPWATPGARMQLHWVFRMSPGKKLSTSCGTVNTKSRHETWHPIKECISSNLFQIFGAALQVRL